MLLSLKSAAAEMQTLGEWPHREHSLGCSAGHTHAPTVAPLCLHACRRVDTLAAPHACPMYVMRGRERSSVFRRSQMWPVIVCALEVHGAMLAWVFTRCASARGRSAVTQFSRSGPVAQNGQFACVRLKGYNSRDRTHNRQINTALLHAHGVKLEVAALLGCVAELLAIKEPAT